MGIKRGGWWRKVGINKNLAKLWQRVLLRFDNYGDQSKRKERGFGGAGEMSKRTLHCRRLSAVFCLLASVFSSVHSLLVSTNDNDNKMLMAQIIVKQERKTEPELE